MFSLLRELQLEGHLDATQARFFADSKPPEELYDLINDPNETINLATTRLVLHETLDRFRGSLDNWIKETGDLGAIPETMKSYEAAVAGSTKHFKKKFKPDAWHERSEAIRAKLVERKLKPATER